MAKPLGKMSLENLQEMRGAVLADRASEDGKMTIGEYVAKFGDDVTKRAEKAAVLAQLDDAIAKLDVTGSEKIQ